MATYVITIASSDRTSLVRHQSFEITEAINSVDTLRAEVVSANGSVRPAVNGTVVVTENGTRIFGGLIESTSESGLAVGATDGIVVSLVAKGYSSLASRRLVTVTLAPGTLKSQLTTLVAYLSTYGTTLHASQSNGPTMPEVVLTERRLDEAFNDLAAMAGTVWRIDHDNALRMWTPGDLSVGFNIANADGNTIRDIVIDRTRNELYANRVILSVTGAGPQTSTETFVDADGVSSGGFTTFTAKYPASDNINDAWPNLLLFDGVVQGPIGWGAGTAAWSWDYTNHALVYDEGSGAAYPTTEEIEITYAIKYPFTVTADDATGQAAYGLWERKFTRAEGLSIATAQTLADGLLAQSSPTLEALHYDTTLTVEPGRTQTVTVTKRNVSGTALVQEVITRSLSASTVQRSVSAVMSSVFQGTFRGTLEQWMGSGSGAQSGGSVQSVGAVQQQMMTLTDRMISVGLTNSLDMLLSGRRSASLSGNTTLTASETDRFAIDVTSAAFSPALVGIGGVRAGGEVNLLINSSGTTWSIKHNNSSVTPTWQRFECPNGADFVMRDKSVALLWYDASAASSAGRTRVLPAMANIADLAGYEEGTWTPALNFGGAATGITYTNQAGRYTKVGRQYVCSFNILLSSKGSATGSATITGLPATLASTPHHAAILVGYWDAFAAGVTGVEGYAVAGGTTINLRKPGAGGQSAIADTDMTNTSGMIGYVSFSI